MNLNNIQWMNVVFFVKAFCCMTIVARKLFLGTSTPISLSSVLSSLSSSSSSSSSSVTMMALTAGTSRTLIEIGNNNISNNDDDIHNQKEFELDVSYLDGDYENGLLLLRRRVDGSNTAAIGIEDEDEDEDKFGSCQVDSGSMMAHTKSPHNKSVLYKVSTTLKKMKVQMNPFVASSTCICIIVMGNIASMIGILPIGLSGFVPALSIIIATVSWYHT